MSGSVVAVVGASPKLDRYSNIAQRMLVEYGYDVVPVSPLYKKIDGVECLDRIVDIQGDLDTVTLYVTPKRLLPILGDIILKQPRRVIFNPGTESEEASKQLSESGILCENACTLVLLRTEQF